jgi:hypothetical protein
VRRETGKANVPSRLKARKLYSVITEMYKTPQLGGGNLEQQVVK